MGMPHTKLSPLIAALLAIFLGLAVFIHLETIRHPYIGAVLQRAEEGWKVTEIDPSGKAATGDVRQGDRVLTVDGLPVDKQFADKSKVSLVRADTAEFMRGDGSVYEIQIKTESRDVLQSVFSIVAAALLQIIGLLAYYKNSASSTVRRFCLLNYIMALVILTVYSTELLVSDLILSICSVWLPYLLLSFCVSFVLRAVPALWSKTLYFFRLACILFSCYTIWAVSQHEIPGWIRETVHLVFMMTLLFILLMIRLYWNSMDRVEKNHALGLGAGLCFSFLPYLFLYAIPDLLWNGYILAPEYALIGLVPLSGVFLYILDKRSMVDMNIYLPRLMVHILYYGGVFLLIAFANRMERPVWTGVLFGGFAAGTMVYRRGLRRSRQQAEGRREWLEQQKLKLSIQMAETRNIQDILSLISDMLHRVVDVEGVCMVWHDGTRLVVHGTGRYKDMIGKEQDARWIDRSFWERGFDFEYVASISDFAGFSCTGYLCIGPKGNLSLFSVEEKRLIDEIGREAARLLTNARLLTGLQKELQHTREQHACDAHPVHDDIRQMNHLLMEAQQAERVRLSYYLHDRLLQNLIFLSRDLEEMANQGRADNRQIASWLKCLYESQQDIRALCDELYPHIVDKAGLEESLRWLLRTAGEKGGLRVSLHYDWPGEAPDPLLKSNLFRMIRELVHNVLKHAEATELDVRVKRVEDEGIYCTVSDDGKGFDAGAFLEHIGSREGAHLGLISVNSQIGYLGGEMELHSTPGEGTRITLRLRSPASCEIGGNA
ncbi:ATP-binding protein [Paenibacillus dendritiformis]|uniref:ATP-binding protein n=1 Tax=Paenibacillus dendritiformis TaxID=130049 RepID=UPI0020C4B86A|nr:ATP-binding protein [Paenibacillus dendritiformis]CAH8768858.1 ATP-binding protein [Paenibacillus dendritiformis]